MKIQSCFESVFGVSHKIFSEAKPKPTLYLKLLLAMLRQMPDDGIVEIWFAILLFFFIRNHKPVMMIVHGNGQEIGADVFFRNSNFCCAISGYNASVALA